MLIRPEDERDRAAVRAVHLAVFAREAEADLVAALRERARPIVSLVAEVDGAIVGHVMFSPVQLSGNPKLRIMGLAPLAVAPPRQRRGIGAALVRAGLERGQALAFGAVVVLGDPAYYRRFGFSPAARAGITCEYDAPEDAFADLELRPGSLHGATGTITYHPAFTELPDHPEP